MGQTGGRFLKMDEYSWRRGMYDMKLTMGG
jgi:hypothetical protein